MKILLFLELILIVIGLLLLYFAFRKKSESHPYNTNGPRVSIFNLKRKDWFSSSGYKLHVCGMILILLGLLLGTVYWTLI